MSLAEFELFEHFVTLVVNRNLHRQIKQYIINTFNSKIIGR
jgi:hypothetical protein